MNKCLLVTFGVLAVASIVAAYGGAEVGYEVAIKHIPKHSKYGYGIGQSVRYDKRIVPVLPKKFIGEEVGLGYGGGYGMGLGGLGFGGGAMGLGRGGLGLGVGGAGFGGAGFGGAGFGGAGFGGAGFGGAGLF